MKLAENNIETHQLGAVTLEIAVTIGVFMFMVLLLVDLTILFSKWQALTAVTAKITREAGVSMSSFQGTAVCSSLEDSLKAKLQFGLTGYPGLENASVLIVDIGEAPSNTPYRTLLVTAEVPTGCFAIAGLAPLLSTVKVSRYALVENISFNCS